MTEKQFKIGQRVTLPHMTPKSSGKAFQLGGNAGLLSSFIKRGESLGYDMNDDIIIPVSAKVVSYDLYNLSKNCYEIFVQWIDPFSIGDKFMKISKYRMLESEFLEFKEPEKEIEFVIGDWVYYKGGCNTEYWQPGMVGQISDASGRVYRFDNKKGDMDKGGANYKEYFRRATLDEINRACAGKEYYTDAYGQVYSKPSDILSNRGAGVTLDAVDAQSVILTTFVSSGEPSVPFKQQINDETKVSFQSTKLIANKVNNSKDIENFLLIN